MATSQRILTTHARGRYESDSRGVSALLTALLSPRYFVLDHGDEI